jgi:CBS domain-containing protein
MHRNNRFEKQGDKLLKMPGKLDRGPVDFKSRMAEKESNILALGSRDVISVPPTTTILGAIGTMTAHGFRRLPVSDPGTKKIKGIVTAGDVIDFMGGGSRYNLVQVKHKGNLIAAINESIREIMTQNLTTVDVYDSITDVVTTIIETGIGGLPIVDEDDVLQGIITERDVLRILTHERSDLHVENIMSTSLHVTSPESPLGAATKEMVTHQIRRLPVVSDDVLIGMITASDVMKFIGGGGAFNNLLTGDVADIMNLPVRELIDGTMHTTIPEEGINRVAQEMLDKNVGALPVIENSRIIGLVTEYDCVKALVER